MKGALNSINIYTQSNYRVLKQDMPSVVQLLISRINSLGLIMFGSLSIYLATTSLTSVTDTTVGTAYHDYGFVVEVEIGILMAVICMALLIYIVRS